MHGRIREVPEPVQQSVARLHRDDGNRTGFRTETGNLVGTFAYMSPEQADGKASRVGPPTDVYQTALVLFELLTGEKFESPVGSVDARIRGNLKGKGYL